jgi:hypothetical protein
MTQFNRRGFIKIITAALFAPLKAISDASTFSNHSDQLTESPRPKPGPFIPKPGAYQDREGLIPAIKIGDPVGVIVSYPMKGGGSFFSFDGCLPAGHEVDEDYNGPLEVLLSSPGHEPILSTYKGKTAVALDGEDKKLFPSRIYDGIDDKFSIPEAITGEES